MTRDQKIYRLTYWIACFILGGTFALAAYIKFADPGAFVRAVERYKLTPSGLVNIMALGFQWLEIFCAVCLLGVPRLRKPALWVVLGLLIIFSGAITINLIRGAQITCGCFNNAPDAEPLSWMTVGRNLMLMTLVGLAFVAQKRSRQDAGSNTNG